MKALFRTAVLALGPALIPPTELHAEWLKFHILTPSGAADGAQVTVTDKATGAVITQGTTSNGSLKLDAPKNTTVEVEITLAGHKPHKETRSIFWYKEEEFRLTLQPLPRSQTVTLTVKVKDGKGKPVPEAFVELKSGASRIQFGPTDGSGVFSAAVEVSALGPDTSNVWAAVSKGQSRAGSPNFPPASLVAGGSASVEVTLAADGESPPDDTEPDTEPLDSLIKAYLGQRKPNLDAYKRIETELDMDKKLDALIKELADAAAKPLEQLLGLPALPPIAGAGHPGVSSKMLACAKSFPDADLKAIGALAQEIEAALKAKVPQTKEILDSLETKVETLRQKHSAADTALVSLVNALADAKQDLADLRQCAATLKWFEKIQKDIKSKQGELAADAAVLGKGVPVVAKLRARLQKRMAKLPEGDPDRKRIDEVLKQNDFPENDIRDMGAQAGQAADPSRSDVAGPANALSTALDFVTRNNKAIETSLNGDPAFSRLFLGTFASTNPATPADYHGNARKEAADAISDCWLDATSLATSYADQVADLKRRMAKVPKVEAEARSKLDKATQSGDAAAKAKLEDIMRRIAEVKQLRPQQLAIAQRCEATASSVVTQLSSRENDFN